MSSPQLTLNDVWILFRETDRRIKEMSAETRREFKETRREFKEIHQQFKETDQKIKEVSEAIGKLGNRLGEYIEEMVRPAAVRLFRNRGIDVHEVHQNIESQRIHNGIKEGIEVDLLVVNNEDVIAIECKSNVSIDDVNEHLQRLEKLKRLLPTYTDKKVMGAISGMILPENVARYAYKKGLFVMGQSGEYLIIRNDTKFNPKIW
jgi:hypothetical protein